MSSSVLPAPIALRVPALLPQLAVLAGFAAFLLGPNALSDPDTFWHIAAGRWILLHHAVAQVDPFSYTFAGRPWTDHEWLSETLTALAFQSGGWNGVLVLHGAAAGLAFALLARWFTRATGPAFAAGMLLVVFACVAPDMLARPHILALPLLVAWTARLQAASGRGDAPPPWLLALMVVWANMHGSFLLGIALAPPLALEAVAAAPAGQRRRVARGWALFVAASVLAAMISPNTWHGVLLPFRTLGMTTTAQIDEWKPLVFGGPQPTELALMALLYVGLSRGVRLPPIRLLLVMGLLHLALAHARHQMLFGVVGGLLLAAPLGRALHLGGGGESAPGGRGGPFRFALATVGVLAMLAVRAAWPSQGPAGPSAPVAALAHVPPGTARRPVLNDYDFGGYLVFAGVPTFIDGRAEIFGDRFISDYLRIRSPDRAAFEQAVARWHIGWTMLETGSPLAKLLDTLPGWRRLYADRIATIHVRAAAP